MIGARPVGTEHRETGMIDLHTAPTPNGWKISVMLEECDLPYLVRLVSIRAGEQFREDFVAISPNAKIPAIVDHDPSDGGAPVPVFETGAILLYLAEKSGRFLPSDIRRRKAVLEWLFWQVGGLGPMLGQHGHFKLYAPDRIAYALDRYHREAVRLYEVLERRLQSSAFIADEEYTIADMATFPWIQTHSAQEINLDDFPAVKAWYETLKSRPALRRGMNVGRDILKSRPDHDEQARAILFGIRDGGHDAR